MTIVPLLLLLANDLPTCVVGGGTPGCPAGEFCAAQFDLTDASCPASGSCLPLPPGGELTLPLPVPAGARVYCTQGVLAPGGHTHAACSEDRRFAIDLASSAFEAPNLVLASADGIAYGWGDCRSTDLNHDPPDATCNLGLGNVVRVQHRDGLFTQYAHLSAILIVAGQRVKRGDPVGIEGNSGAAGSKHLHFSLHAGDASRLEPARSLPMRRLRTRGGRLVDSLAMNCGVADSEGGPAPSTAYVSDNVPSRRSARIGFTSLPRFALESAAGKIFDPATRPGAIALLRRFPDEVLSRYWLAVALELDRDRDTAQTMFTALARSPVGPEWIRRWSWLRIADIHIATSNAAAGRRALTHALEGDAWYDADFHRFADYVRRALDWLDQHPAPPPR